MHTVGEDLAGYINNSISNDPLLQGLYSVYKESATDTFYVLFEKAEYFLLLANSVFSILFK